MPHYSVVTVDIVGVRACGMYEDRGGDSKDADEVHIF